MPVERPIAVRAADAPARTRPSNYPPELAAKIGAREKRPLGDLFGLRNFGVNLTRLPPGVDRPRWARPPAETALMQAVKARFDPHRTFAADVARERPPQD